MIENESACEIEKLSERKSVREREKMRGQEQDKSARELETE